MKISRSIRASVLILLGGIAGDVLGQTPDKAPVVRNLAPVVRIENTDLPVNDGQAGLTQPAYPLMTMAAPAYPAAPGGWAYGVPPGAFVADGAMPPGALPVGEFSPPCDCPECSGKCGDGGCGLGLGHGLGLGWLTGHGHGHGHHRHCGHHIFSGLLGHGYGGTCCTPRWLDVSVEGVMLKRSEVSDYVPFTSLGFDLAGNPDIVLSSNSLELDYEPGVRITGAHQVSAGSNLEITYMGMTHWASSASFFNDTTRLWSPFSNFGTDPSGIPFIGYDDVDRADAHMITLQTNLNTIELLYRRRMMGPSCRLQGSWTAGFRYLQLSETFRFNTVAPANTDPVDFELPYMNYLVQARNHLYGFQAGGDVWMCLLPGFHVGAEAKGGIYANAAEQDTTILASSIDPPQLERDAETAEALVGELNVMATYRINQNFTLRAGYMVLYADNLALGTENFNSAPPTLFNPTATAPQRIVTIDTNGNAIWHGGTIGAEYMW